MRSAHTTAVHAAAAISLTGAFLCGLSLVQHGSAADCGGGDCSAIAVSRWATLPPGADLNTGFGVPVALVGLMYFSGLAAWFWVAFAPRSVSQGMARAVKLLTGLSAAVSLIYLGLMASSSIWCPLCLAIHFVNFAMLPFVWIAAPELDSEPAPLFGWQQTAAICAMLAACELAVWFGWDSYRLRSQQREMAAALSQPQTVVANYKPSQPATLYPQVISLGDDALLLVAATKTPAATLEIFTDVLCPGCRTFEATLVKEYAPLFQGRLNVVLRHFPLCSDCNPGKSNLHPWSCEAAYLVEAARLQQGCDAALAFMHDIDSSRKSPLSNDELKTLAAKHGLDPKQLLEDAQSQAVKDRIAADVKLGQAKQLKATPSLFLDGQAVAANIRTQPEFWQTAAARVEAGAKPEIATADGGAKQTAEAVVDPSALLAQDPQADRKLKAAKFMMDTHDLNHDAVLDSTEAAKLYQNTAKFDRNQDGKIELAEIALGIKRFNNEDVTAGKPNENAKAKPKEKPQKESARQSTVFPGDVLPLAGPTLDGKQFDLAQWQGKSVIVAYWATWCTHCVDETAELKRLYQTYHERGLEIVGISADRDAGQVEKFVAENEIPWPQLMSTDPETRGMRNPWTVLANIRALPTLILIGPDGQVADVHLRGRKLELALAKLMNVDPSAEEIAAEETEKLKGSLVRPVDSKHITDPLQVGDVVSVAGPTIDGGRFDISSMRGKAVLVAFWATWCPHCRKEIPKLLDLHARYKDRGLEIVGVSLDRNADDLNTFLGGQPVPWPTIFIDKEGLRHFNNPLAYWFGVKGIPSLFLIDQEGRIAALKPRGAVLELEVAKLLGQAPPSAAPTSETNSAAAPPPAAVSPTKTAVKPTKAAGKGAAKPTDALNDPEKLRSAARVLIKRLDKNQNEVLEPEEWAQSKVDYSKFDGNSDKRITVDEMVSAVQLMLRFEAVKGDQNAQEKAAAAAINKVLAP